MAEEKFYININRQFGSLGRPVARELANILGIEYYDRDIVEKTAQEMNLSVSKVSEADEEIGAFRFAQMALPLGGGSADMQDAVFKAQSRIITTLADRGSCIFVGRCADYILRDQENCLNIYIYAPKHERYLNCVNSLNMKPDEAKKMIDRVDKARDRYWMHYAKRKPYDPECCHLMINSSVLGVTGTAELLAEMVKARFGDLLHSEE